MYDQIDKYWNKWDVIAAYLQIDCNLCYVNITFIDQAEIQTISRVFTIKETWEKKKHFIYKNIV